MSLISFIDDAFESFLQVDNTPVAIKFLFDYFDSSVQQLGIADPDEVTHSWKSNRYCFCQLAVLFVLTFGVIFVVSFTK
jgi:Plexin cytoplasmic RasGAP domain